MTVSGAGRPLRLAVYNQVNYHLHVVAGAMRVLQALAPTAPITVFLTSKVLQHNHFGFMDWLGGQEGFVWKDIATAGDHGGSEAFDFVWFISPEFDLESVAQVSQQMRPALQLFYIHNGHMPDADFKQLAALSRDLPLVGMAPHVAAYVTNRLQEQQQQQQQEQPGSSHACGSGAAADWLLPIWPFEPQQQQQQQPRSQAADRSSSAGQQQPRLKGFSITGSLDQALRSYGRMWEQISSYSAREGPAALQNFKLNILGDVLGDFAVPDDLQQYVELHKSPPDPVFYDVIYHSYGIVPALANPAYYTCKLTSAVITTLMTGVPVLADSAFLGAYTMLSPATVFEQRAGEDELEAMFRVAQLPAHIIWQTRTALQALRQEMNDRCVQLLRGWLKSRGLDV